MFLFLQENSWPSDTFIIKSGLSLSCGHHCLGLNANVGERVRCSRPQWVSTADSLIPIGCKWIPNTAHQILVVPHGPTPHPHFHHSFYPLNLPSLLSLVSFLLTLVPGSSLFFPPHWLFALGLRTGCCFHTRASLSVSWILNKVFGLSTKNQTLSVRPPLCIKP